MKNKFSINGTVTITMSLQEAVELGLFSWLQERGYELVDAVEKEANPADTRVPTRREVEIVLTKAGWTHNLSGEAWYSRDNSRWIIFTKTTADGRGVPHSYNETESLLDSPVEVEKENCAILFGPQPRGWAAFLASEKSR